MDYIKNSEQKLLVHYLKLFYRLVGIYFAYYLDIIITLWYRSKNSTGVTGTVTAYLQTWECCQNQNSSRGSLHGKNEVYFCSDWAVLDHSKISACWGEMGNNPLRLVAPTYLFSYIEIPRLLKKWWLKSFPSVVFPTWCCWYHAGS